MGTLQTYLDPVYKGIYAAAQERGCNLLLACGMIRSLDRSIVRPAWPTLGPHNDFVPVGPWNTDGLIVVPPFFYEENRRDVRRFIADGHPMVSVGGLQEGEGKVPEVLIDYEGGIRQALMHLVEHGHRRIVYMAGDVDRSKDSVRRFDAYRAACEEYSLGFDPELVACGNNVTNLSREAMRELLRSGVSFTAVLANSDESAVGVAEALREAGLRIPEDVALVGFDNRLDAAAHIPPITTVDAAIFERGYRALEMLLDRISGRSEVVDTVVVPTRLILRQSCGCRPEVAPTLPDDLRQRPLTADDAAKTQLVRTMTERVLVGMQFPNRRTVRSLCDRLVEAFCSGLAQDDAQRFHLALRDLLRYTEEVGDDPHVWQMSLSTLREGASALEGELGRRARDMLEQAQLAVDESGRRQYKRYVMAQELMANAAGLLSVRFREARTQEQMLLALAESLPSMNVRHAAVVFYEQEGDDPVAWSALRMLTTDPEGSVARFPTYQFPPEGLYPQDEPFMLALLPLVVQGERVGFVAFDAANLEPCALITRQLAVECERRQAEEMLHRAYTEIERQVEERTAELRQEIAERERAEKALAYEQYLLHTLMDNTPDAIYFKDATSRFTRVSRAQAGRFGLSDPAQVVGRTDFDFFREEHARKTRADEQEIMRTGRPLVNIEEREVWPDGRVTWASTTKLPLRDEAGNIVGTFGISRDITERKRAEEGIRRQAAQLEALRQVGLELVAELDLDALLQSIVSHAVELLEGAGGGMFLHRPELGILEWAVSVGDARVQAPIGSTLRRGEGLSGKVWETGEPLIVNDYQHWEGRAADFEELANVASVGAPVRWGNEFFGVLNVLADVSRPFNSEDAELLDMFAAQAAAAIRNARLYEEASDRAERLAVVNRVARAVGATLDLDEVMEAVYREVVSIFRSDVFFVALYDEEADELNLCIRVDEGRRVPPSRCPAGDGLASFVIAERKPLLVDDLERERACLPELSGAGKPPASWLGVPMQVGDRLLGIVCVQAYLPHAYGYEEQLLLSTIADQVALALENIRLFEEARLHAKKLEAALAQQAELDRLKDEFIQNVSHELRSPLALIRGYAELLNVGEFGEVPEQQQEPVEIIARRAQMLSELVDDITLILETEARSLKREPVALGELARTVVEDFQLAAGRAGLTLEAEIAPGLPRVSGETLYLRRVLDNLLGNAVKFTPCGGRITVLVEQRGDKVILQVSDTGVGIPPKQQERIFERFYQVDGSARRRYGGVGLGLALVKEVVEVLGGEVSVESDVGRGSTFTVVLPVFGE